MPDDIFGLNSTAPCNKRQISSLLNRYKSNSDKIMIEYVRGELAELSPAYAVVDTGGVGYGLNISLNTYTAIQGKTK